MCLQVGVGFAQEGHPLTGTWTGDWKPAAGDVRHVTVVLEWDGTNVTGTIDPGPNAARFGSVALDVSAWTVRINAARANGARIVLDGRLADIGSANRTLTGTWTEGSSAGAATLRRVDSLSVSSSAAGLGADVAYDGARRVTLRGTVTHVDWINPRALLYLNVRDQAGATANWKIDVGNPLDLERSGWKGSTLNPGDAVTVQGVAAVTGRESDAARQVRASSIVLTASGRRVFEPKPAPPAVSSSPAPRWPDGQVRLGPAPGAKGYWGPAAPSASIEKTAIAAAMPWAKAVYDYRQRTKLRDDPLARCVPPGGPRQFFGDQGFQLVEQRELGRILVLLGDGDRNWRIIYTDGRPLGQPADVVASYYGSSVGRWDKDTLVVDSVGYNEKFWFMSGGLPHTDALHLTERFTRQDLNTLKYEVTVEDPRTYTKPWTGAWTMRWMADREIQEFFCEEKTS
jgi:Family of unknown function (DUF6152)